MRRCLCALQVAVFSPLQSSTVTARLVYDPPRIEAVNTPEGRGLDALVPVLVYGQVCHRMCCILCTVAQRRSAGLGGCTNAMKQL